jgi:dTDP-4-amino-4,6-dideoxygalactose transaminase
MKNKIWLSSPHMSGKEMHYINEAFNSNWIAPLGPNVNGFENDIKEYLKEDIFVAALSSGTAAIHLGLMQLGVEDGDEVICQSKTFSASANPIIYQRAIPIFVDSEKTTWNMSAEQLEIAIKDRLSRGKKPKAIVAVHLYGMPYNVDLIHSLSKEYDIPILEDSAEALGSSYKEQKCGTFGDISVLSFNGNKIITTSGGGALISRIQEYRDKSVFLATQARDEAVEYHHTHIGYNYRMSNIIAGIGRGQMTVIDDHVKKRRSIFELYKKSFVDINEIGFLEEPNDYYSNRWLTCITLPSFEIREDLRLFLEKENIESRPLWKPMHLQPIFKDMPKYINGVSDDLFNRGLCIPSGSNLSEIDLERVISNVKKYFKLS